MLSGCIRLIARRYSVAVNGLPRMTDYIFLNNQPVVSLDCEKAFNALSEKEKHYAHYLSRASWYGGLIVLIQTSPESPLIYTLLYKLFSQQPVDDLKQVAVQECGWRDDDFTALLVYTSGIFTNMGNYKGFGDSKFIPNLKKEQLDKLIKCSAAYKNKPKAVQFLWDACELSMFSLKDGERQLGFSKQGTTTYFSRNCNKEDAELVKKFLKDQKLEAYNSRVFKTSDSNGNVTYEIRLASVASTGDPEDLPLLGNYSFDGYNFAITRGDYSKLLALVIENIKKAKEYAANNNEEMMLENYIKSFRTGSLDAHKDGSRFWIKDKAPVVEMYIGFIETYRDPAGMRGEFEGFVAMVNKPMSAKFAELVNQAETFLPSLPWPPSYEKDRFLRPDFTSLDVLTFAGSGIPAGICIPNYHEIRQDEGFKNVSLGNVIPASYKDTAPNYLNKSDQELLNKHRVGAFEVQVGLHELLGHGSGKLFKKNKDGTFNYDPDKVVHTETKDKLITWYEEGETFDSVFSSLGSAYEECRAECVGLFLSTEPKVLKIFGYSGSEADDVMYIIWLSLVHRGIEGLQMYQPKTESWLQAHCQARFAILQVLLEAGKGFMSVKEVEGSDGYRDLLLVLDRSQILSVGKPAIGDFLRKLQVYKATADITSAEEMFKKYSKVDSEGPNPFLEYREIVIARKKPRKMFVQSNTFEKEGKIALKNYSCTHEDLICSWIDRFRDDNLDGILQEAWNKDKSHFMQ